MSENLGFLIANAARLMRSHFQQHLEHSSLTFAQSRVLVHLSHQKGIRQVDLAEILEIQPMTLARYIDQLEERGLVERKQDPTDRRAYQVNITKKSKTHLVAINKVGKRIQQDALSGLTAEQTHAVLVSLQNICENLKK